MKLNLILLLPTALLLSCSNFEKSKPSLERTPAQTSQKLACILGGIMIRDGEVALASRSNNCTDMSSLEERGCIDGTLTGSYSYFCVFSKIDTNARAADEKKQAEDQKNKNASTTRDCELLTSQGQSMTIPYGHTIIAYQNSRVPKGSYCMSESRTCGQNGRLSGKFLHTQCVQD